MLETVVSFPFPTDSQCLFLLTMTPNLNKAFAFNTNQPKFSHPNPNMNVFVTFWKALFPSDRETLILVIIYFVILFEDLVENDTQVVIISS